MWTFASALLLPLVVEGQYMPIGGGGCAPPAAESPCLHSCGATSFDLSGFKSQMTGQYFHAKDDQQHDYFFVPCGAIKSPAAQCPSQPQVPSPNHARDSCKWSGKQTNRRRAYLPKTSTVWS